MASNKRTKVEGEGSYTAARQYDEATRKFVQEGKVPGAARRAAPRDPAEQKEMTAAEQAGKRRAKGEDPALEPGARIPQTKR